MPRLAIIVVGMAMSANLTVFDSPWATRGSDAIWM